jgi:hypothetical protein
MHPRTTGDFGGTDRVEDAGRNIREPPLETAAIPNWNFATSESICGVFRTWFGYHARSALCHGSG